MPTPAHPHAQQAATSFMWRCAHCARLHLSDLPTEVPEACLGCGSTALENAAPTALGLPGR